MKRLLISLTLIISANAWTDDESFLLKCDGFGRGSPMSVLINISGEDSWIETPNRLTNINNNVSSTEQELETKQRPLKDVEITEERIKADFKVRFGHWATVIIDRFEGSAVVEQRRFRFAGDCAPYERPKSRKF